MKLSEVNRRANLPPLERAVSDTLDEYLSRMHGIIASSWVYPVEFLQWLRSRGYEVRKMKEDTTVASSDEAEE